MRHAILLIGLALAAPCLHAQALNPPSQAVLLFERINAHRTQPQSCEGKPLPAAPALRSEPALSKAAATAAFEGRVALQREGFEPARVEVIRLGNVDTAERAMPLLLKHHCRALMDPVLTHIGVQRDGREWSIVLAQPLLAPDLGDWRAAGKAVLALVNEARAKPRQCGDREFAAAPPLAWSEPLAAAALAHSRDMAQHDRFEHSGSDGSTVGQRVRRQNYRFSGVGENIAAGPGSAQQAVAGWLRSPGHCENVMRPDFREMGAAYVQAPKSQFGIFWTQVFAW